jgi:hypothetical protein
MFLTSIWQEYHEIENFNAEEYAAGIFGSLMTYVMFYWWNKILIENLNESMVSARKFKKVMDCSKEAICIIQNNKLSYLNDIFILMFQQNIMSFSLEVNSTS